LGSRTQIGARELVTADLLLRRSRPVIVRNEFSVVKVELDNEGNGDRLRLEDMDTGRVIYLDALQLENLVWLPDDKLTEYMDPSAHRWRDEQTENEDGDE
jgi:hypothetical protein